MIVPSTQSPAPEAAPSHLGAVGRAADLTAFAAAVLLLAAFSWHDIVALDIWWQLKTGELVLESGWPRSDPFSYAFPGRPWIEVRWLFCVAAHLVQRFLGFGALVVAKTVVLAGTALVLARVRRVEGARLLWPAALGITLFALTANPRFMVRPEIVTFFCLALVLERLAAEGAAPSRRTMVLLVLLQVLWVNTHTTFILGPAVLWIFLAANLVDDFRSAGLGAAWTANGRLAAAAATTTAACLLNPYLVSGAVFPFRLLAQIQSGDPVGSVIQEFASPLRFPLTAPINLALGVALAAGAAGLATSARRQRLAWASVWLAFVVLAVMARRNVALLGLVSAVVLIRGAAHRAGDSSRPRLATIGMAVPVLAALVLLPLLATDRYPLYLNRPERFGLGVNDHQFPIRALDFVRRQRLPRPVFGKLGDGGYFLYEGGPASTYVDGRLEVYDGEAIERYRRLLTGRGWDEEMARLGVRTAVLRHPEMQVTAAFLERHPQWHPVYFDPLHVVYLRAGPAGGAGGGPREIDWRTAAPAVEPEPDDVIANRDLATLLLLRGQPERARHYLERAHDAAPGMSRVTLVLAALYRATGDESGAARLMTEVRRSTARAPDTLVLQARILEAAARPDLALEAQVAALEAGGGDAPAVLRLALALGRERDVLPVLEAAADRQPASSRFHNDVAAAYLRSADVEAALAHLETSLAVDANQARILTQAGILAARLGRIDEARDHFEAAIALDPNDLNARTLLSRLSSGGG